MGWRMHRNTLISFVLCVALSGAAGTVHGQVPVARPLKCEFGPISKIYGGTPWLVYGCGDNRSVAIIAAPDNPAKPYYYLFSPTDTGYWLTGEGTGSRRARTAAFAELKRLTDADVKALIEETTTLR